jgi:peptide chain release factor 2
MEDITEKNITDLKDRILFLEEKLNFDESKKRIGEIEKEMQDPSIWDDLEKSKELSQELKDLKQDVNLLEYLSKEANDLLDFYEIVVEDESLQEEFESRYTHLEKDILKKEVELNFNGKYDKENAVLTIMSGAGGKEAEDWAQMLLRMYQRYFEKKGFNAIILTELLGDGNEGIKTVSIEVQGRYAYGYLRRETGVHRLVRISPFSAQGLRHTSFALVDILPVIKDTGDIDIKEEDIRMDFFRASGPGGQYVNKRDSAVRLTHIPTGVVVSCQAERSQGKNKEKAMSMLSAKLYLLEEEKRKQELNEEKGEKVSAGWGNQIRSYVLHPYRMVKDLRTKVETSNTDAVLDGNLDKFIEEEIKLLD